jgi:carboxymethylenebutenolidase
VSTRNETIEPGFEAHVALPASGNGPGVLLIQEIFGVGEYIKDAARRLSELGYVVLAPDLYWRIEPGLVFGAGDMERAFATVENLDREAAVQDAVAALAHLRDLPEVTGGHAGVLGFCLGGNIAWLVAAYSDPEVAVCYYGSLIAGMLDVAEKIECPVLLHFGGSDPYIPREDRDAVAAVAAAHEGFECHVQEDAGHAFDNNFAPQFTNPAAAAAAWELTSEFLARTLPAG